MRSVTRRCFASWDDPRRGVRCCCCFRLHIGLKLLPIIIIIPKFFFCYFFYALHSSFRRFTCASPTSPQLPPPACYLSTQTKPSSLHSHRQIDRSSSVSEPNLSNLWMGVSMHLVGRNQVVTRCVGAWCMSKGSIVDRQLLTGEPVEFER